MFAISTAKNERKAAIEMALKRGAVKTHEGLGIMSKKRPAEHPVTLEEIADGCLDAPDFIPAGGFVVRPDLFGCITTDCIDR